jgi:hypothetical protein
MVVFAPPPPPDNVISKVTPVLPHKTVASMTDSKVVMPILGTSSFSHFAG